MGNFQEKWGISRRNGEFPEKIRNYLCEKNHWYFLPMIFYWRLWFTEVLWYHSDSHWRLQPRPLLTLIFVSFCMNEPLPFPSHEQDQVFPFTHRNFREDNNILISTHKSWLLIQVLISCTHTTVNELFEHRAIYICIRENAIHRKSADWRSGEGALVCCMMWRIVR